MNKRSKRRFKRGAAAVEFAVIAPFIIVLFLGMVEVGRAMMYQHVLTMAAREGARESILLGATDTTVQDVVDNFVGASSLKFSAVDVAISSDPATALPGNTITVTVSVPYAGVSGVATKWFSSTYELAGQSSMRKEGFR